MNIPPQKRKQKKEQHLSTAELDALAKAAGSIGRHRDRDRTIITFGARHGLRVSEIAGLDWEDVDLKKAIVFITRCKGSDSGHHPLNPSDVRALRKLGPKKKGAVFANERGGHLKVNAVFKIVARAGRVADLGDKIHPHMLRHGCGFGMVTKHDIRVIQAWLGHRNIQNTVRYTAVTLDTFVDAGLGDD